MSVLQYKNILFISQFDANKSNALINQAHILSNLYFVDFSRTSMMRARRILCYLGGKFQFLVMESISAKVELSTPRRSFFKLNSMMYNSKLYWILARPSSPLKRIPNLFLKTKTSKSLKTFQIKKSCYLLCKLYAHSEILFRL